jgi:hypothetical protein
MSRYHIFFGYQWRRPWQDAFICVDCSVNTSDLGEYYMVQNLVWQQVGMTPDGGMLCIGCLESRLGRCLGPDDFVDAPINYVGWSYKSDRFLDRLGPQTPRSFDEWLKNRCK